MRQKVSLKFVGHEVERGRYIPSVMRSPRDKAIPCVLLRIRTCPEIDPVSIFSMLKFARASSPNRLRAYRFAERKSQSPDIAPSGVRHAMFVEFMMCFR